jgi:hypothetical protein
MNTDTTTPSASRIAHRRVGGAATATFLALLLLGALHRSTDADTSTPTGLMHHLAIASLPVALGLVALALGAWGALAAQLDDEDTVRLSRTYLDPFSTWALIALGVHTLALWAAGEAGGLAIALSLLLAAGAVALRIAPAPAPTATATAPSRPPEPPRASAPAPAPLPTGPVAPTDRPLWAGRDARRPRSSTGLWNG